MRSVITIIFIGQAVRAGALICACMIAIISNLLSRALSPLYHGGDWSTPSERIVNGLGIVCRRTGILIRILRSRFTF